MTVESLQDILLLLIVGALAAIIYEITDKLILQRI